MKRFFQKTTLLLLAIAALLLHSCNKNDIEERTEAMEKDELSQAITNLTTKGYNVDTTALGVYYVMSKIGTGNYPKAGDTCDVIYTGFFLNGFIFDASYSPNKQDSIYSVVYKTDRVVAGFQDAIGMLNKDAKANFFIPSRLAYGINGYDVIPPWMPLGFEIKMKNIRPAK